MRSRLSALFLVPVLAGTPPPARVDPPAIVVLDLLSAEDQALTAAQGQFFEVQVLHRAPSAAYRVTADWLRAPSSPKPPERPSPDL